MNKKEIKNKVAELLSSGTAKSEVFAQLSGQGVKDKQLAYFIAAYVSPWLSEQYAGKVNILISLMFIQALLVFFIGYSIGAKISPNAPWIIAALITAIPLLFAWGFYKNNVGAYNAYILLSVIQLPRQFSGFMESPIASSVGLAIGLSLLGFVWYLQQKLFPDFVFITPKKIKGQYVFSDQPSTPLRTTQTQQAAFISPVVAKVVNTNKSDNSRQAAASSMTRTIVFALLALFALGGALYLYMPGNMQYSVQDAIKRPFTPNFDLPPNLMKSARQDEWIAEYTRRGYDLRCYGNLRPEEKVSIDDDYNCWGIIKSAYDNIPALMVMFWFHKGELRHIKIEFPESSFAPLQDYLGRHFEGVPRLDQLTNSKFGKDVYGKPLMVWPTNGGIIVASNASTAGQPLTLRWTSREKIESDILAGLLPPLYDNSLSSPQVIGASEAGVTQATIANATAADAAKEYETTCGGTKFRVTVINSGHPLDNTITLAVVTPSATSMLFKAEEGGWFDAACLQAKAGKPLLVFQSYCGGSGCLEGKYGAVEPSSLTFLLRPSSKNIENHKQLSDLLGPPAPHLADYQGRFCCGEISVLQNLR